MASDIARLTSELHDRVLVPLVTGKLIRPLEPIEPEEAELIAQAGTGIAHGSDGAWVDVVRVRHVRLLCPLDTLPHPGRAEWLMTAALNNLLLAANDETNSLFSPNKTRQLVDAADTILGNVPRIDSAGEALCRHATFARLMKIERIDVHVSWWSGSARYRGRAAPARLLHWPELRRVQVRHDRLALADMVAEDDELRDSYDRAVSSFLAATPLTDVATCTRSRPKFRWTEAIVAMAGTDAGHALLVRAARNHAPSSAAAVLREALAALNGSTVPWVHGAATALVDELAAYQGIAGR